jgi:hypothetical protein
VDNPECTAGGQFRIAPTADWIDNKWDLGRGGQAVGALRRRSRASRPSHSQVQTNADKAEPGERSTAGGFAVSRSLAGCK